MSAPNNDRPDLIPDCTVCALQLTIRPGNAVYGLTVDGDGRALDCQFTVIDGQFAGKQFSNLMMVEGPKIDHAKAGEITKSKLRAILESARGIKPDDVTETACKTRRVNSFADFDGLRFVGRVGVDNNNRNILDIAITPDRKEWRRVEQHSGEQYQHAVRQQQRQFRFGQEELFIGTAINHQIEAVVSAALRARNLDAEWLTSIAENLRGAAHEIECEAGRRE